MRRGQAENRWPQEVLRHYGHSLARALQSQADDQWAYFARCKRAMVVRSYIDGRPMGQIETDATTNAHPASTDVRKGYAPFVMAGYYVWVQSADPSGRYPKLEDFE